MSDNVETIPTNINKLMDSVSNQLRQEMLKSWQSKLKDQVKVVNNAKKVVANEVLKLKELAADAEREISAISSDAAL